VYLIFFNKIDALCMKALNDVQTGGARDSKIKIIGEKRKMYKKIQ